MRYSLVIVIIVAVANVMKLLAMIGTLRAIKNQHFITLGDAMASFLEDLDSYTIGICLADKTNFEKKMFARPLLLDTNTLNDALRLPGTPPVNVQVGQKKSSRWLRAPSELRWVFFMVL